MFNFSMSELIRSDVAIKNGINNTPNPSSLDNLFDLIVYCLQPVRNAIDKPMIITSGYRCAKLNKLVGGTKNSHHLIGCAADFIVAGLKPSEIINIILKSDIRFNQLINEYDKWVHISYIKDKNKNQVIFL